MREDLQKAFPHPFDHTGFAAWWEKNGVHEYSGNKSDMSALSMVSAPKKTIWSALGGIISRPAMLGAYMARARQIMTEKGIKGLLCEIRTRI
ncbi:MAG TPA: hypothetical protein PLU86_06500, partial [Comamonas denitrificans]|nr:hypothetical protein [Comamonas denitrificans]